MTTVDTTATQSQSSFDRNSSFANDSGNRELGTSPGQTSPGTADATSTLGVPADAATLGINGTTNSGIPTTATGGVQTTTLGGVGVPGRGVVGDVGVVGGGGIAGGGVNVNVNPSSSTPIANTARTPTPLFDDAARRGSVQVKRQTLERTSPVDAVAPRTNNDRTDQMPDDPIIRY
ncbi:MAG TPA: hypothetical protein VNU21_21020 [Usitatibacter sp.]|nr:hypothetical protein [Usitatibacter sp.]